MATRFIQDFTNKLLEENSLRRKLSDASGAIGNIRDKGIGAARDAYTNLSGGDNYVSPRDAFNAAKKVGGAARDVVSGAVENAKSYYTGDKPEDGGRRADVKRRLAAGGQTTAPSGGQAMAMRATSPREEKRIEDYAKARPRKNQNK